MSKYVFGVDIGGTTVKLGVFSVEGELLDKWEIKTRTEDGGANVLPDIAEALTDKMNSMSISKDEVKGVGMGVPGPVREDGTVDGCVNLGWGVFNAAEALGAKLGLPVKVGNDAKAKEIPNSNPSNISNNNPHEKSPLRLVRFIHLSVLENA